MKIKKLLSMAFAAALMTAGSLKAVEEAKVMPHHENGKFTPGHTVEEHKMNGAQARHNEPLQKRGNTSHGMNNERQNHQQGVHKPLPINTGRNADTHHQMEHGAPHHSTARSNVSSMGQPWPKLSAADQVLYKQNMNDIMVLQNGLFSLPKFTGGSAFDVAVYDGTLMRDILQTCDAFCQDTNQDRCAFVEGLKKSHGLSIPVDRQAFLSCFYKGAVRHPSNSGFSHQSVSGICQYSCPALGVNSCVYYKIRQGCKLLCCGMPWLVKNCLGDNQDGCAGF